VRFGLLIAWLALRRRNPLRKKTEELPQKTGRGKSSAAPPRASQLFIEKFPVLAGLIVLPNPTSSLSIQRHHDRAEAGKVDHL